jgi:hypothetical protein
MRTLLFGRKTLTFLLPTMVLTLILAGMAFSQALAITTNEFVPFAQAVVVPCANGGAGEVVLLEGVLHIQNHLTINGNRLSLKTHAQPQGVEGTGTVTGDKYRGTGVTQEQDSTGIVGAAEISFINNFRLIGQGPDNNFQVHQNIHVTIDANNFIRSNVLNTTIDCN